MQPVDTAGAVRVLLDQPGLLQQAEVAGHGRPADRHVVGQRPDGPGRLGEEGEDLTAVRVAERAERIA